MNSVAPFIRWAGGKTWLINHFDDIIGKLQYKNYYEPFLGSAAIFFSLEHKHNCYLSDVNQELIDTYISVRDTPQAVIDCFLSYCNTADEYYRIRALNPEEPHERAARFIFLNQTSFNGLYRVNRQGQYNVPYGKRSKWSHDCNRILKASQKLQKVKLKCADFTCHKRNIKEKDLVFLDPPYTVSHNNNGFIEYNKKLFSLEDQHRLNEYINHIKSKGAYYILTNAAHLTIQEIFSKSEDRMLKLYRNSLIGGNNAKRKRVSEYIFTNIPEGVYDNE